MSISLENQRYANEKAIRAKITADPLRAAPAELEHDIFRLWACVQHLIPSPLPIAGLMRVWVDLHGLTIQDAKSVLYSMLAPDCVASFGFATDVTTMLAARVDAKIKAAAKAAEVERRRIEQERFEAEATPAERGSLKKMFCELGELGRMQ